MKVPFVTLALVLGLGLAAPAKAQDDPAKKEETPKPAAEAAPEAAKEEAPKEAAAAPAAAKEEPAKAAAAAAPAAAAAAAPAAHKEEPKKELSPCAKSYVPLAESYKKAYDDMEKWLAEIDAKTSTAGAAVTKLQDQIQTNETAITKAKLDGDDAKAKSLTKENKQLWSQLTEAKKASDKACSDFSKAAADRVKQYAEATNKALADSKAK